MFNLLFLCGLMLMDFEKYCVYCCMLLVVFKFELMKLYVDVLNEGIRMWVVEWLGGMFDFYLVVKELMFDLVVILFFGILFGLDVVKINKVFVDMV